MGREFKYTGQWLPTTEVFDQQVQKLGISWKSILDTLRDPSMITEARSIPGAWRLYRYNLSVIVEPLADSSWRLWHIYSDDK